MEVKIGIQNVAREIVFESGQSADEVADAVEQSLASSALLRLKDIKGRLIVVPGASIGYVEIGAEEVRRVGFGAL
ncbi:DUF3107 domain-containing protein [Arthrobacter zhaoxinii]|uniref:DUF3107 domain-containing protein n=1 Tax=Arthrobacter zhaoxinii TaxID=2964616 RepID=A0ABY5YNW8_9MICC|nr:DUF3107 domain-containing protein [Arthrobacter zhaoxinii]MCQ1999327.1 DUF3107 domain-containing protein [Arthrobacter zhaoxinii]UWX96368.1 DUF3107 domain-containing protein [Arthrobacter zhaoxinii]